MAPFRGLAAVVLVSVGAWGLGSATTSPAFAATPEEILELRAQPCPQYRVARSHSHTAGEVEAAKDGSFEVRGGMPAELIPPVDWTQDPYHNRSWVHYLHGFMWVDQLLYAYVHDGDLVALEQARDLLLDWIVANPRPAGAPEESWKDKTTGDRAGYLGFVTRAAACEDMLSDAEASTLINSLREHGDALADPEAYEPSNHGLFVDFGLALIADYASFFPESAGWDNLARYRFRNTVAGRLQEEEGVWLEHSGGYQLLAINLVEKFANNFDPGAYDAELARMRAAAGWMVTPAGKGVPFGDSDSGPAPGWAQEEAQDASGLNLMHRSGLAAVREGDSYLLVTAGFHNRTHKHADELGFHLYDHGGDVISDSGVYHYNLDKWREFSGSAAAHSVLSIGNRDFPIDKDENIYGSGIRAGGTGDGWYAIEGRNPLLRPRVRHRRLFLYRPGRALVIVDLVDAKSEHRYVRRFQVAPEIRLRRRHHRLRLRGDGFAGALRDQGDPARLGIVSGRYAPPGGWSFPTQGVRVARPTVTYRSAKVEDATYVTAFGLDGGVGAKLLQARKRSMRVRVGGPGVRDSVLRVLRRGRSIRVRSGS